jgi:hypothetical protein
MICITGGTGLLGGALADLPTALIGSTAISDKTTIYVKADGTYSWNSDTLIPGSGCYQNIVGYGTYRYDQSRATVSIGASSTFIKNASFMKIFNVLMIVGIVFFFLYTAYTYFGMSKGKRKYL